MPAWNPSHLFDAVDRISRRAASYRGGVVVRECAGGGWIRHLPGDPPSAFASTAGSKVVWATPAADARPVDAEAIASAQSIFLELGCRRAFAWLAPMAWSDSANATLIAAGAVRVPNVRYLLLAREIGRTAPASPPCAFTIRRLDADEAARVMDHVAPWYSASGAAAAARQAAAGREILELHAAFDADEPVALGGLITLGDVAYLGWAGTDPGHRGRGAQSALIAARLSRARELGLRWGVSETNTAVETSLNNLRRAGFEPAGEWAVYEWNFA